MKTTIDLPDDLVRKLKLRAVNDRRKLKDLAAELLRSGLAAPSTPKLPAQPVILKDKKTGLPVIQCRRTAASNRQLLADEVAQILIDQEALWANDESAR